MITAVKLLQMCYIMTRIYTDLHGMHTEQAHLISFRLNITITVINMISLTLIS
jgi:hypothetical protein